MWPGTGNSGGWRSPQASAGIPANTRESARSGKKKPQPRTVGVSLLVEVGGTQKYLSQGIELQGKKRVTASSKRYLKRYPAIIR